MATETPFSLALIAGGCAGTSVDIALFPLDTLRTRQQAPEGFIKAGGFRQVYSGMLATAIGASPGAACFFATYEATKAMWRQASGGRDHWLGHSFAASIGEVGASVVRVPTMIITQRMQVGQYKRLSEAIRSISAERGIRSFYVGFWTTVAREIPFSLIQFPLYERLKQIMAKWQGEPTSAFQGAACGSAAGAVAAAITTPLDLVKTRMMLERDLQGPQVYRSTVGSLKRIAYEEGVPALFRGLGLRVSWITAGGFIFFGAYEKSLEALRSTGYWS